MRPRESMVPSKRSRPAAIVSASKTLLSSEWLILWLCGVAAVTLLFAAPGFATAGNVMGILESAIPLLLVATGETIVLIGGGIDLSVTAVIGLSSVIGALVMNGDSGWLRGSPLALPVGVLAMLATGALAGGLNGLAVARLRMPSFIVTLTTTLFLGGLAVWIVKSETISGLPPAFNAIGGRTWIAFPITIAIVAVAHLLLARSLFGRWIRAVGYNPRAARLSGVPVGGVIVGSYVASGLAAAAASILITGKLETGSPVHGESILLDVIGAAVLGGTSLSGGRGKVLWTVAGALFLVLIDRGLNLLNQSNFAILVAKGTVILVAALLDALRKHVGEVSA